MLPSALVEQVRDFIEKNIGLYFPQKDPNVLEKKLLNIAQSLRKEDPVPFFEQLITTPVTQEIVAMLARYLTIGETYFFRDTSTFTFLKKQILPEIIQREKEKRIIRIWCAGCATGEEPYSIAILLSQLIPQIADWDIVICGTDINEEFLSKARTAEYKKWSFRTTPPEIKECYFKKNKEDSWVLNPNISKLVKFDFFNLMDVNPHPHLKNMNLITCNNILIYFTPKQIAHTVSSLTNSLAKEGWLCVTPIEVPYVHDPRLVPVTIENSIFFKKNGVSSEFPMIPLSPKRSIPAAETFSTTLAPLATLEPLKTSNLEDKILKSPITSVIPATSDPIISKPNESDFFVSLEKLYQQGLYKELIQELEAELKSLKKADLLSEKQHKQIILLTRSYANLGLLNMALMWCKKILGLIPFDPVLYCLQATILQEQENIPEAIQSLRSALYLNPSLIIGHFELGCLMLQQGKYREAERYFRHALQLIEKYPSDSIIEGTEGITTSSLKSLILSQKVFYSNK